MPFLLPNRQCQSTDGIKSNESFTEQKSGLYRYNSRSHFRRAEQVQVAELSA